MLLILTIVALTALKYFEVRYFDNLSWWWIVGLSVAAFLWFEFFEHMFGFDKRRAFEEQDKVREERIKKVLKKK